MFKVKVARKQLKAGPVCFMFGLGEVRKKLGAATICVMFQLRVTVK